MARPLFKTMGTIAKSKAYGLEIICIDIFFKKDTIVIRERGLSDGLRVSFHEKRYIHSLLKVKTGAILWLQMK